MSDNTQMNDEDKKNIKYILKHGFNIEYKFDMPTNGRYEDPRYFYRLTKQLKHRNIDINFNTIRQAFEYVCNILRIEDEKKEKIARADKINRAIKSLYENAAADVSGVLTRKQIEMINYIHDKLFSIEYKLTYNVIINDEDVYYVVSDKSKKESPEFLYHSIAAIYDSVKKIFVKEEAEQRVDGVNKEIQSIRISVDREKDFS